MTGPELACAAAALVVRSTVAQGVAEKVEDPSIIGRVVALLGRPPGHGGAPGGRPGARGAELLGETVTTRPHRAG